MALNLGELNAIIDADDSGFHRTIERVHKQMDRVSKRLGGLDGLLRGLGRATAFSALATGAAGLASSLGPVISLVGTLGTAVAGLGAAVPAFAVGGAAVIGTLTLAFQGLGEAIAGDEEALASLTGPAREFVAVVEDLKPAWEDIQQSVQARAFDNLAGIFERVAGNVLPHLKDGLGDVADGLNDVAGAALDAADLPEVLEGLDAVLENTGDGLSALSEGISGWARGLGILMGQFAPLLERAGIAAANLGERFGDWISQAAETGRLQDLMETMLDTLSTLGGIVQNLGSVFASVFGAANEQGGGLLSTVEDLTGQLAEFFDSAQGQDALNSFFSALADVADDVIPIVLELADAIATDLAPHFATIADEVGPSLRDLVRELGDAIGEIDVASLAGGFADVLGAVTPLIGPLGDILGAISSIDGLVPVVVGALVAWTAAQWALNIAMYANPILLIITLIIALIAAIVLLIVNWDTVWASLVWAWDELKRYAGIVWNAIADFFVMIGTEIKDFFVGLWNGIVDFFSGIWDKMVGIAQNLAQGTMDAIGWLGDLPGRVAGWFQGVYDSAVSKLESLVSWVQGIPGMITDALGDLGSLLWDAGKDLLQGFLDGIMSMWGDVQDRLSSLTDSLPDWKGPAERDRTILGPAGEMVIGGFVDGIERAIPSVQRALQGLTTDIGLSVDGAAAPSSSTVQVDATASLSETDRELLRELAEARNRVDVSLGANLTDATQREYAMGVE